jgi:hypothetical protein
VLKAEPWKFLGIVTPREARAAFVLVAGTVLVIALLPGLPTALDLFGWDKLNHLAAFGALTILARSGWPSSGRIFTAIMLFGYGIGIEILQSLPMVNRTFSPFDLIANGMGIGVGLAFAWIGGQILHRTPFLIRRPSAE